MPALIHFHRKWLIACDDLVIPFAIESILRTVWLIASIIVTWFNTFGCDTNNLYIKYLLYTFMSDLILTLSLCIAIFIISSRGSVLKTEKRIHLPKVLYAKCATVVCEFAISAFGAWILFQDFDICSQWKTFIQAATVCHFFYVLAVILGIFICYNSLGSSIYWSTTDKVTSAQLFKKAERIWRLRLKCFCCCADVSEDEHDFLYVEFSSFLASYSNDIDLAPTDILAGLITVSKKHAIQRRKIKCPQNDLFLANKPKPNWMTAENALYYLRIAKSTYGWAAFFNLLYPWKLCTLLSPFKYCLSLFEHENSTKHGDCCFCNSSAMEKITGLPDSDILYASFSNSVYEPAFVIAFDHSKKVVIIAIRGTCSFSDVISSMDLDDMSFPAGDSPYKFKCHRGALRSALFIHKKINDLNVLKTAFNEKPSYTLTITGHSLGGSIAVVLGMLLHPEYPSLQCYAFAPLAAFSAEAIPKTLDFVFSVVVGDDMVPRLSAYSFKELIKDIYSSLEETNHPKYKLLTKAFWRYVKKKLKLSKKLLTTTEVYENKQVQTEDESSTEEVQVNIESKDAQLYAPGQILYLQRTDRGDHSWVTGFYFQNIIVSPSVMKDHQPHQIQLLLEKYKSGLDNAEILPIQQQLSSVINV